MLAPGRRIEIKPQEGGFLVEIIPPLPEGPNHDQWFATYRGARGYGGGLRMVLGLKLVDLCDEANGQR